MLKRNTVAEQIWNFLYDKIKNEYAVAGLMGNLYAESGLSSINLQDSFEKKLGMTDKEYTQAIDNGTYDNFITDKAGYGLAQWTYYSRKQKLLEFTMKSQTSIGDLEMQLNFLIYELQNNFKPLWKKLQIVTSVKAASDAVLLNFEKPLDQSKAVKDKRAAFATYYYDNYATKKNNNAAEVTDKKPKVQTATQESLKIINCFGINNTNYLPNRKIEWIVIHYTAGTISKGGSALNSANGAKSGGLNTSAEFYVDDTSVVQYIQDIKNRYSWSVGGAKWDKKYTSLSGVYYGKCTNQNSINIEICSNKTNKKSLDAEDPDWYFTESELKLAAALVRKLMKEYNININHVIMHHHVTGKLCPQMWCLNENKLSQWEDFLTLVNGQKVNPVIVENNKTTEKVVNTSYVVTVTAAALNVRSGPSVEYKVNTVIKDKGKYTIIEEKNGWGKLKSGAGWINLKYTIRN